MNIKELAELIGDMAVEMTGDDYRAMFDAKHALLNQQAEITRLNARVAELEKELDGLSNSYATCGKPECTPTQVCELFFNGCRS